mmetsp:Transcript_12832/g.30477  ORF Transcript_12832/g.30477 Transcript_12832/m.30477 type:complete len:417 (-) Transcript_12832:537-1787(-)
MRLLMLKTIKALASLLMIVTMLSIIILDTLLAQHDEPHLLHGNRILEERDFTTNADHVLGVSAVSSKNRDDDESVQNGEVGEGQSFIIPLETRRTTPSVPSIKSSKSSVLHSSSLPLTQESESESESSGDTGLYSPYTQIDYRYHITRYRRSNPDIAQVNRYESIYDPMIKPFQARQFPHITCQGSGLIIEASRAPTIIPTRAPVVQVTRAPVVVPTRAPVITQKPTPTENPSQTPSEMPTDIKSSWKAVKRVIYHGSISDVRIYGKPKRIVHQPGHFLLPVVDHSTDDPGTRAPTMEPTKAPTPFPTPRVFHKVCRDGRVVEIDGTHAPTIIPTMAPTYSPVGLETRPPAYIGYVWGNGYGMENHDDSPRWSFSKNEGQSKLLFDHPNIEKAIYRGNFAQMRRQYKRRVDTLSPW